MAADLDLSVVVPAYLEEENLRVILPRLKKELDRLGLGHEVLVVDTQPSLDNTAEVCAEFGAMHLPREGGSHYGAAVVTGIRASRGDWVVFMDADGSHAPEFIRHLWQQAGGNDVVIASRYVPGGFTENPWTLQWMSLALNAVYTLVLGLDCKDVSNSFKLYRGGPLRLLRLKCRHFDIVEEILVRYCACVKGVRVKEVPFVFKKRLFGNTKRDLLLFMLSFIGTLARLFWIRITTCREA